MPSKRILVTITGRDEPGITAQLTAVLAQTHAALLDIEQVVVQGQLTLCLLIEITDAAYEEPILKDMLFAAKTRGSDTQFNMLEAHSLPAAVRILYAVTLVGNSLDAAAINRSVAKLVG